MNEPAAEQVREEVRAWLAEHWDPDLSLTEWRRRLVSSGWGCPTWPAEWFGKGFSPTRNLCFGPCIAYCTNTIYWLDRFWR